LSRLVIRDLRPSDWPEVAAIYAAGIATRNATFETAVPPFEIWDAASAGRSSGDSSPRLTQPGFSGLSGMSFRGAAGCKASRVFVLGRARTAAGTNAPCVLVALAFRAASPCG
jgi:phosphinothricin acetyltransferase